MELTEIVDDYLDKTNKYHEKRQKLEDTIEKKQKELKRLINGSPSWVQNILVPLAKELKKRLGLKAYDIYGPFGCECETTIYLSNDGKDGKIEITKVETYSLTIRPVWKYNDNYSKTTAFELTYWTGESTNLYPKGTIGELNGMNHIFKPLPNNIDDIVAILEHKTR